MVSKSASGDCSRRVVQTTLINQLPLEGARVST
jgi:hypothetical protein